MDTKIGIGTSNSNITQTAGTEAIQSAIQQLDNQPPTFLILFADSKYDHPTLLNSISQVTNAPLIGCTTAGEITPQGPSENSLIIVAFSTSQIHFSTGIGQNLSQQPVKAAEQAAQTALSQCRQPDTRKTFLFFTDGLTANQVAVLQGLQNILGENFEIVGATAADCTDFQKTYVYHQGQVYNDSLVGVLIAGDIVTGTGIRTGWQSVGNSLKCTKAKNRVVYELDNQPALDIYSLYLDTERSQKLPQISFEYPFGIISNTQQLTNHQAQTPYLPLRACININQEDKGLTFGTEIPEGSLLTITAASRQELIHQTQTAAQLAKDLLVGAKPLLVLNFASLGRRLVLKQRSDEELATIKEILGQDVPMAGFYTYGEFGPLDKRDPDLQNPSFHNLSSTIWVLGSNIFTTQ